MSSNLISFSLLTCEKVLTETDNVVSVIRLVDIFKFQRIPDLPLERQAVQFTVFAQARFKPGKAHESSLQFRVQRPSGEVKDLGPAVPIKIDPAGFPFPEAPQGFATGGPLGIVPREFGLHWVIMLIDGEEVARTPVTLIEQKPISTEPTTEL